MKIPRADMRVRKQIKGVSMRSLLKGVCSVIALAMLGFVTWDAVRTAGAQGGGFPSRPTFQQLSVLQPTTGGFAGFFQTQSSGAQNGLQIDAGSVQTDVSFQILNQNATSNYLAAFGDGSFDFGNGLTPQGLGALNVEGGYYVNNTKQPQVARATVTQSTNTTCTASNNVGISSPSCGNAGTVTVTLSGFSNAPVCTGNVVTNTLNTVVIESGTTSTSMTYITFNTTVASNGVANLICVGT
jgi:hypothetical protein